jgi:hypothetical protein
MVMAPRAPSDAVAPDDAAAPVEARYLVHYIASNEGCPQETEIIVR